MIKSPKKDKELKVMLKNIPEKIVKRMKRKKTKKKLNKTQLKIRGEIMGSKLKLDFLRRKF